MILNKTPPLDRQVPVSAHHYNHGEKREMSLIWELNMNNQLTSSTKAVHFMQQKGRGELVLSKAEMPLQIYGKNHHFGGLRWPLTPIGASALLE